MLEISGNYSVSILSNLISDTWTRIMQERLSFGTAYSVPLNQKPNQSFMGYAK
jgi:hypothetical protein